MTDFISAVSLSSACNWRKANAKLHGSLRQACELKDQEFSCDNRTGPRISACNAKITAFGCSCNFICPSVILPFCILVFLSSLYFLLFSSSFSIVSGFLSFRGDWHTSNISVLHPWDRLFSLKVKYTEMRLLF